MPYHPLHLAARWMCFHAPQPGWFEYLAIYDKRISFFFCVVVLLDIYSPNCVHYNPTIVSTGQDRDIKTGLWVRPASDPLLTLVCIG